MGELDARTILAPTQGKQVRRTTPRLPEAAAPARESPVAVRPCDCSFLDVAKLKIFAHVDHMPAEMPCGKIGAAAATLLNSTITLLGDLSAAMEQH